MIYTIYIKNYPRSACVTSETHTLPQRITTTQATKATTTTTETIETSVTEKELETTESTASKFVTLGTESAVIVSTRATESGEEPDDATTTTTVTTTVPVTKDDAEVRDVDENGNINASDAAMILVFVANLGTGGMLTEQKTKLADVDGDNVVNASDAADMGAGKIVTLQQYIK